MILSGNNSLSLPETHKIKYILGNISPSSYELIDLGLSGNGASFNFRLQSGKISDPLGRNVYSYKTNKPFTIEGIFEEGNFRYSIDGQNIVGYAAYQDFAITGWYLKSSSGKVNITPQFYTPPIDYNIVLQGSFPATSTISGSITNNSEVSFTVEDYSIIYYHNDKPDFTGTIYGKVPAGGQSGFLLYDAPQLLEDHTFKIYLSLRTNAGEMGKFFNVSRVSGFNGTQHILLEGNEIQPIVSTFSGESGYNSFVFQPTSGFQDIFYSYNVYNLDGIGQDKTVKIQYYPIYPTGTGYYTGNYLTGFEVTNSGFYSTCPIAKFSGYYAVSDIDFITSGILMSSGCTGNIPFYGVPVDEYGAGLTGHTVGKTISISGVYDNSTYYIVTGFVIENSGTGYTQAPIVKLNSGVYANCKDVPELFGSNQWLFEPFKATAVTSPQADYLSGETFCYSGSGLSYYQVSGIIYTNVGSGYDESVYVPRMHFERVSGDTYANSGDASGVFKFNKSPNIYSLDEFWSIETGLAGNEPEGFNGEYLDIISGYTGQAFLLENQSNSVVRVHSKIKDYPGSPVLGLSITPEVGPPILFKITGERLYSKDREYLKKKLIPSGDIVFAEDEDLSFFITAEDSIKYYNYDEGEGFIYE